MSYGQYKVIAQSKIRAQTFCEVLWRIVWVVYVPLKLIFDCYAADSNVDLDYTDLLQGKRGKRLAYWDTLGYYKPLLFEVGEGYLG